MEIKKITEKQKEDKKLFQNWEMIILEELNQKEQEKLKKDGIKNS